MIQQFTVKNFRCFDELELGPLARINLIAGKNNTGKTALLEAILLHQHPGDCEKPFELNRLRGVDGPKGGIKSQLEWLFPGGNGTKPIELASRLEGGKQVTSETHLLDAASARARFPQLDEILLPGFSRAAAELGGNDYLLIREVQPSEGSPELGVAFRARTGLGLFFVNAGDAGQAPAQMVRAGTTSGEKDLDYFSELERANRQEDILPALRHLEPRLKRLALLVAGGEPALHGDIELPRLVPLSFMGEGVRRLLSILLVLANIPGGVLLIDEVENGLHHSVLVNVWKAIAEAARHADVQVFATTHSYECIMAAHEAFKEAQPYDLRLFRLDRTDRGIRAASYDEEILTTAYELNHEVR
jgi:hypothetical protein